MAYTRTQWVEQETPLSAQNMNNIEDGIEELQSTKVDKATGKGLSDQNYTAAEKTKLAGIAEGAEVNVQPDWNQTNTSADDYIKNKPGSASSSAAGLMSAADKSKLDGVQAGAQVNRTYTAVTGKPTAAVSPGFGGPIIVSQVAQDANGQVSVTDRTITLPNYEATTSARGLMSASDKAKLDTVETGAEKNRTYTAVTGKPTKNYSPSFGSSFIVSQVRQDASGQVSVTDRTVTIPNKLATTASLGLMSASDKRKLDGISLEVAEAITKISTQIPAMSAGSAFFDFDEAVSSDTIVIPYELPINNLAFNSCWIPTNGSGVYVHYVNPTNSELSVASGSIAHFLLVKSSEIQGV